MAVIQSGERSSDLTLYSDYTQLEDIEDYYRRLFIQSVIEGEHMVTTRRHRKRWLNDRSWRHTNFGKGTSTLTDRKRTTKGSSSCASTSAKMMSERLSYRDVRHGYELFYLSRRYEIADDLAPFFGASPYLERLSRLGSLDYDSTRPFSNYCDYLHNKERKIYGKHNTLGNPSWHLSFPDASLFDRQRKRG